MGQGAGVVSSLALNAAARPGPGGSAERPPPARLSQPPQNWLAALQLHPHGTSLRPRVWRSRERERDAHGLSPETPAPPPLANPAPPPLTRCSSTAQSAPASRCSQVLCMWNCSGLRGYQVAEAGSGVSSPPAPAAGVL